MPEATTSAAPFETIEVTERVVACDGGGVPANSLAGVPGGAAVPGVLGHPRVYLRIVDRAVVCPYCSRLFVLKDGGGDAHGH